jgi:hypothetical protein
MAPGLPITVKTMRQDLEGIISGYLFFQIGAQLTGAMGLLGLILAVVGVYSVVSYAAAQRMKLEFAWRWERCGTRS